MTSDDQEAALKLARTGDRTAQGDLLESFRPYLAVLTRSIRGGKLQGRFGDSDLVQDALLLAHRHFDDFRGTNVAELKGWLRQIVLRTTGHVLRANLGAGKRDAAREQGIEDLAGLAAQMSTPSGQAIKQEDAIRLTAALARLPGDMQQVILARHVDGLEHAAIAERLGRSVDATRILYVRALRRLKEMLAE